MVSLLTAGILAFIISFGVGVNGVPDLTISDFSSCDYLPNVRRLVKSYAYEKVVLGLSISAIVISSGLTVLLFMHACKYCRCCDGCY